MLRSCVTHIVWNKVLNCVECRLLAVYSGGPSVGTDGNKMIFLRETHFSVPVLRLFFRPEKLGCW